MKKNIVTDMNDLPLIEEKDKDVNTFMYDYTIHHRRTHFCHYCFQALRTTEIFKCNNNDCFKVIKIPKKREYVGFKNYEEQKITIYDLCRFSKYFKVRR